VLLTRECDYGIRVVRELADGRVASVKDICKKEDIPQPFAYKLLKKLEKAGIVKSYRGYSGGYQLVKPLDEITIFDIVSGLDEQLRVSKCLYEAYGCENSKQQGSHCILHGEMKRIQESVANILNEKSFNDILKNAN
jgi:Rrf2 family protein